MTYVDKGGSKTFFWFKNMQSPPQIAWLAEKMPHKQI